MTYYKHKLKKTGVTLMTSLDTMILDYITIGTYWAFNATVVFFSVMLIISGMLHTFWGILEGVDNQIFYPQNLHDMDTTDTKKSRGDVTVYKVSQNTKNPLTIR